MKFSWHAGVKGPGRMSVAGLLLFGLGALAQVGEDRLPSASWISSGDGRPAETVFFRRLFSVEPGLVQAVVTVAAERRATIYLNGEKLADHSGYERATSFDATRLVRSGTNLIGLRVDGGEPGAVCRLLLELAGADGRQRWVVSDPSWSCSNTAEPTWLETGSVGDGWTNAVSQGEAGLKKWGDTFGATRSVDAYNSWMLARGDRQATDAASVTLPPGFKVELLRSARPEEGSWVSLAFDPKGRLTVAREVRGLLRFDLGREAVDQVEVLEDTLLECRGLLYAHGALYLNANNSKGLYRLSDTDGDDRFDEKKLLLETGGGVGHGRNHLRLGPDGWIYAVHGDDVELPASLIAACPGRHSTEDRLVFNSSGVASVNRHFPKVGQVIRLDAEGGQVEVVATGLRNPLDIAFDPEGELFTYDADNERDIATPWYRPTRVLHIVSGGEYGWRRNRGAWPTDYPDTLPAAVDIGVGSPTGVEFGTRSRFPDRWRRALFIADWAYGRILAVWPEAAGASFGGSFEPFVSGRPLNVTDLTFGPDGAMYFITGGRGTMSGLYRVSWVDVGSHTSGGEAPDPSATALRELRHRLEALHRPSERSVDTFEFIWTNLSHHDRWIRFAARVALEQQPLSFWEERGLGESQVDAALAALLALVRVGSRETQMAVLKRLGEFSPASLSDRQRLDYLRIHSLVFTRGGLPTEAQIVAVRSRLEGLYPSSSTRLNQELCRLLVLLRSPAVVAPTCKLLARATRTEELLHYLFHLQHASEGWTLDQRRIFFDALGRAEHEQGARDYSSALKNVRRNVTSELTRDERSALGPLLRSAATGFTLDRSARPIVQTWTLADFPDLGPDAVRDADSLAAGRDAFLAVGCQQCHRLGAEPGGTVGPDLTSVASRFGRRDLLDHILNPSKFIDEKFRNMVVILKDGSTWSGWVESEDEGSLVLSPSPGADEVETIQKSDILTRELSGVSPMPSHLLDWLTREQVLELLNFLEAARPAGTALKY